MKTDANRNTLKLNQAVILAGGRGERLRPFTDSKPKPMFEFHSKPFLEYIIEMLRDQGITNILLLLGYLPEVITNYFGDGSKWNVKIQYSITSIENDTGRRIKLAENLIEPTFLLLYCDNYWPMHIDRMWTQFNSVDVTALVTVYENKDNYTKNNLKVNDKGYVEIYDKSRTAPGLQGVDIGFLILKKEVLKLLPSENVSFEKTVYPLLVKSKKLQAYSTSHRYYSVSTHERLKLTDDFLLRKPTIFLDRDGVLNKKAPKANYVTSWDKWEWIEGVKEAVSLLKKAGYRIILITNQAGIGRGVMKESDLFKIHEQMKIELNECGGGSIDKIYYCPHGWDEGCECRKPKPGMLFQAQRDFNLDLSRIYFIGDDERDEQTGYAAGCKTLLVNSKLTLLKVVKEVILGKI